MKLVLNLELELSEEAVEAYPGWARVEESKIPEDVRKWVEYNITLLRMTSAKNFKRPPLFSAVTATLHEL